MWELDCKESWVLKNWCFWTVVLEKTLESPLDCKEIQPVHPKGDQSWVFIGRTDVEAETPILWPPHEKSWLIGKDPDAGRDWGQEEKGMREDEMAGWDHWLDGHEFEWTPGVGDGQGGLVCLPGVAKSWTWLSNWTELNWKCCSILILVCFYSSVLTLLTEVSKLNFLQRWQQQKWLFCFYLKWQNNVSWFWVALCLIPVFVKCCCRFFCYTTPYDSIHCPSHVNQYFVVWSTHLWAHSSVSPSWLDACWCPYQHYADRKQKNLCCFKWTHTGNALHQEACDLCCS